MKRAAVTGILFLMITLCTKAQETGIIRGRIFDGQNSSPLANAGVVVKGTGNAASTNASGYFEMKNLPAGTYSLRFSYLGYASDSAVVNLNSGKTVSITRTLYPAKINIGDVVVTALRTEKPLFTVPGKVEVITQQQIVSMPLNSADELLNLVPGISASRNYGIFNKSAEVTMRGLNRNVYTLLLMDGVPLSLLDGSSSNWNRIDPENIERIEIVKGPNSSFYGGNAMGGVINIITKKPKEPLSGSIKAFYGTYETVGGNAVISGRTGKKDKNYFYGTASASIRQSRGYTMQPDSLEDITNADLYINEYSAGFRGGFAFSSRESIEAEYRYSYDLRGAGKTIFEQGGNFNEYKTHNIRARYSRVAAKSQVEADIFWNHENYLKQTENIKYTGLYSFYHTHALTGDKGLWFAWSKTLPMNQELTVGADIKFGSTDNKDVYHTSTDTVQYKGNMGFYGVFLHDQLNVLKGKLTIAGGLRVDAVNFNGASFQVASPSLETDYMVPFNGDFPDTTWFALSPRISAQWNFNSYNRIYAGWSRGFRPGTLSDMCRSGKVTKGFKLANPHLLPETLDNFELGASALVFGKVTVEPDVYYSIGHDFQYFVSIGDSIDTLGSVLEPIIMRKNIGEVHIYGAEINLTWQIASGLDLIFNYSYSHSRIAKYTLNGFGDADLTGYSLTNAPEHIVFAHLAWRNRFLNMSFSAKYSGSEWTDEENTLRTDPYFTADIKLYRNLLKRMTVALTIQNIFNKRQVDSKGYLGPGRFVTGELKVHF